jgi:PAS domain S-box-containing protein
MDEVVISSEQIEQILRQMTVTPEQAGDGIAVFELNGTVRFANSAWASIHGYNTADELVGKNISSFHSEEQMKTEVTGFIEEAKRRSRFAGPVGHVRADGRVLQTQTKMTAVRDKEGRIIALVVFAANTVEPNDKLTVAGKELQNEILKRQHFEERLRQRANELIKAIAKSERLEKQISEHENSERTMRRQVAELISTNELLEQQVVEHASGKGKLKNNQSRLEQQLDEVKAEAEREIAKARSQTVEKTAKEKARADKVSEQIAEFKAELQAKEQEYDKTIAKIKAGTTRKAKTSATKAARLKAELAEQEKAHAEQEKAHAEQMAKVSAESQHTIAEQKTRADDAVEQFSKVRAANKKLQKQLSAQTQVENKLREDREMLEQRIAGHIAELSAAGEKLQKEIAKRKQLERRLRQKPGKSAASGKGIQQPDARSRKSKRQPGEQSSQLKQLNEPLQQEIARRKEAEEDLAALQKRLENITSIVHEHL